MPLFIKDPRVCPPWMCFTFDNIFRRLIQNPERMLSPYVRENDTVLDVGPGKGFLTIPLAGLVGSRGTVIAADIQQKMLDAVTKRAKRAGVGDRVVTHRIPDSSLGIDRKVDFALAFWMVHEVPDQKRFLGEIGTLLKPGGIFLLAEPGIHVSQKMFDTTVKTALDSGLRVIGKPNIRISRAVLLAGE